MGVARCSSARCSCSPCVLEHLARRYSCACETNLGGVLKSEPLSCRAGCSGLLLPERPHILRSPGRGLGAEYASWHMLGRMGMAQTKRLALRCQARLDCEGAFVGPRRGS